MPNITLARRQNVVVLFQEYADRALAQGHAPKGLEQAFAASLQISPSMWSQIKSSRPIGDKLARQIEAITKRPGGWLDEPHASTEPSQAEAAFLELALAAYRSTNAAGRRALREHLRAITALTRPAPTRTAALQGPASRDAGEGPKARKRSSSASRAAMR